MNINAENSGQHTNDQLGKRIRGTAASRVFAEFVGTSALFPILDIIRKVSTEGFSSYLKEPAHYVLFAAALIQAVFLGTSKRRSWAVSFFGNLLGFSIYFIVDLALEGEEIFSQPYHWLYGIFSLSMAVLNAWQTASTDKPILQTISTLLLNTAKVLLLPAMYMIIELGMEIPRRISRENLMDYMGNSGHVFILFGILFFGVLLGLAESQKLRYTVFLRSLAGQLKEYSEWSLGSNLVSDAIENPETLQLQRIERTIMFMDIRGFTAWSENIDPGQAVKMLNTFYTNSEKIIAEHGGHKPNFTADEVMTRFHSADDAFSASTALQKKLSEGLTPFNLAVGIGIHTGEVIEGLMGSAETRKYDIIGDAVNTAKRLESAAGRGEVIMSLRTFNKLKKKPGNPEIRVFKVKGKSESLRAVVI